MIIQGTLHTCAATEKPRTQPLCVLLFMPTVGVSCCRTRPSAPSLQLGENWSSFDCPRTGLQLAPSRLERGSTHEKQVQTMGFREKRSASAIFWKYRSISAPPFTPRKTPGNLPQLPSLTRLHFRNVGSGNYRKEGVVGAYRRLPFRRKPASSRPSELSSMSYCGRVPAYDPLLRFQRTQQPDFWRRAGGWASCRFRAREVCSRPSATTTLLPGHSASS